MQGDEEKHAKLEAEVEQLTWKLRKMEEGAARGQQSEAIRGRDSTMAMIASKAKEAAMQCVHGKADCAVCAVTDEQVEVVRRENLRLKAQIERVGSQFHPSHQY